MVRGPLQRQVEGDLREVVGDHLAGRHVDDRGHGDALGVVREPREERVLEPLDAEHRVAAVGVEVEGPAALVVGRSAHAHAEHVLEAEQPPHDDRAVGPRAGPGDDQPVAVRLDRPAVPAVRGDPVLDVVGVAGEVVLDVAVLAHGVPFRVVRSSVVQYLGGRAGNPVPGQPPSRSANGVGFVERVDGRAGLPAQHRGRRARVRRARRARTARRRARSTRSPRWPRTPRSARRRRAGRRTAGASRTPAPASAGRCRRWRRAAPACRPACRPRSTSKNVLNSPLYDALKIGVTAITASASRDRLRPPRPARRTGSRSAGCRSARARGRAARRPRRRPPRRPGAGPGRSRRRAGRPAAGSTTAGSARR